MQISDRIEGGKQLAQRLLQYRAEHPLILAIPRGGVPVAYEVATTLKAPLDTVVARKISMPFNPEYAVGALAPDEVTILNDHLIASLQLKRDVLQPVIKHEKEELERRMELYKSGTYSEGYKTDTVIIVDDGLATGYTARAAIAYVDKTQHTNHIVFASPVCSENSAAELRDVADTVVCLQEVADLKAIGFWYKTFLQTTDDEVISYLEKGNTLEL